MASILDAGLASIFTSIFVFLLVYAIVYGVLSRFKWFGDKSAGVNAIIAFAVAMLMAVAPPARTFVTFIAPWYIALAIALFFILFISALFGKTDKDFPAMFSDSKVHTWIIILAVIILIGGLATTFGQNALEAGTGQAPTQPPAGGNTIGSDTPYQPPGTVGTGTGTVGPQAGQPGSTATSNFQTNMLNTLLHPKVLGMFVTLIIAAVAIYFLSNAP